MKSYTIFRDHLGRVAASFVDTDDPTHTTRPLPHIAHHSPTGFEMGYAGSGPADLALALLAENLDVEDRRPEAFHRPLGVIEPAAELAWSAHEQFKVDHIATAPPEGLTLTSGEIAAWLLGWLHGGGRSVRPSSPGGGGGRGSSGLGLARDPSSPNDGKDRPQ